MQRDRHNQIPILTAQRGHGFAQKQAGEKMFKPQLTLVFEAVNRFKDNAARDNRRARGSEAQFHLAAIRAFKRRRDVALEWQSAASAKRRFDEAHLRPAARADEAVFGGRVVHFTEPADFGIEKTEADIEPLLKRFCESGHREIANGSRAGLRGRNLKTTSVTTSTIKASQPSINLPVPQNQVAARGALVVNAP